MFLILSGMGFIFYFLFRVTEVVIEGTVKDLFGGVIGEKDYPTGRALYHLRLRAHRPHRGSTAAAEAAGGGGNR